MNAQLATLWHWVRTLATDDAYERYLEQHEREHHDHAPLDRREFYVKQQNNKWSGIQRCC
jgi:uncharacterized short protein YbdD (DUF466 family)